MDMGGDEAILVVGADGLIGRSLADRLCAAGRKVVRTVLGPEPGAMALDLSQDVSGWAPPCPIAVAYLCAAATSLAYCRSHAAESQAVNVAGTLVLANTLRRQGALVVFPSSNLVFDGSVPFQQPDAPVCPKTEYGRQKAEVEQHLLGREGACVVRFTKVLGPGNRLLTEWGDALRRAQPIHPFADMVMAPIPLSFATDALEAVGRVRAEGVIQASGPRDVTYEEAARHVATRLGAAAELVQPITTAESGLSFEHVPPHATLDFTRLQQELGLPPPDVWAAVDAGLPPGKDSGDCPDFRVNENGTVPLDARTDSVDTKIRTGPDSEPVPPS